MLKNYLSSNLIAAKYFLIFQTEAKSDYGFVCTFVFSCSSTLVYTLRFSHKVYVINAYYRHSNCTKF